MTQDPRSRADLASAIPTLNGKTPDRTNAALSADEENVGVRAIARKLAAHGGGAASLDLAFDLVLHEVVEQARVATGATGAAIALIREGEMVCRASAGDSAPDLGVRVETASGLAGICVSKGTMQRCRDTETDSRVNAEACRQLGVRSMLVAPLIDERKIFGILQVFSSRPDAFADRELGTLQEVANRIAESKREAEAGTLSEAGLPERSYPAPAIGRVEERLGGDRYAPGGFFSDQTDESKAGGTRSSVLLLLVIAVAVLLGLELGWRGAVKGQRVGSQPHAAVVSASARSIPPSAPDQPGAGGVRASAVVPPKRDDGHNAKSSAVNSAEISGGLVVTQNGKVIYRSSEVPSSPGLTHSAQDQRAARLIRRVEPEYPADARAQHVQGPVVLDVQILGNGAVGNIVVVSGDPLLAPAAVRAVKQWRYQPSSENGQAIESQTRITMNFTLPPT